MLSIRGSRVVLCAGARQVTDVISSSRMWALADPVFLEKSSAELEEVLADLGHVLLPWLGGQDMVVCGVPFFLCSALRTLTALPFLAYGQFQQRTLFLKWKAGAKYLLNSLPSTQ